MDKRARSLAGVAILAIAAAFVLAGCASAAGPGWTYVPPAATPQSSGAAASGTPGAASGTPGAAAASGGTSSGASGAPSALGAPSASGAASGASTVSSASGATAGGGSPNEIDLVETASLEITNPAGQPVTAITVQKGQTYHFRITNTAGFVHNFYIGTVSDLQAANLANLTGVGDFSSGTREFDYTFSDTSAPLGFGCMVPGHYQAGMKGTFTIQ